MFYCQYTEPVIDYPEKPMLASDDDICSEDTIELIRNMDNDLAKAWRVMRRFCFMANLGTQTQRLICPETMRGAMAAVSYRLLHMRFAAGSIIEAIRHGLLAFSYHVFLQWQDIKLPRNHFFTLYRNRLLGLKIVDGVSSELML